MHGNGVRKRLNREAEARARGEYVPGNRENRPDIVRVKTESRKVFYRNLHKRQQETEGYDGITGWRDEG